MCAESTVRGNSGNRNCFRIPRYKRNVLREEDIYSLINNLPKLSRTQWRSKNQAQSPLRRRASPFDS